MSTVYSWLHVDCTQQDIYHFGHTNHTEFFNDDNPPDVGDILVKAGVFTSKTQARKNGYFGKIHRGEYHDWQFKNKPIICAYWPLTQKEYDILFPVLTPEQEHELELRLNKELEETLEEIEETHD